jgi:hypothetical protein
MRKSRLSVVLPIPAKHPLRKLGQDLRDARRRRRIPVALAAERASISRTTLVKVEKGDPGVAMGIYATVLFIMDYGMAEHLADLADPKNDAVGRQLERGESSTTDSRSTEAEAHKRRVRTNALGLEVRGTYGYCCGRFRNRQFHNQCRAAGG